MKLCDLCNKVTPRLELGPEDMEPRVEVCEACHKDLIQRLSVIERRIVEIRHQQRAETLAGWRRERAKTKDGSAGVTEP